MRGRRPDYWSWPPEDICQGGMLYRQMRRKEPPLTAKNLAIDTNEEASGKLSLPALWLYIMDWTLSKEGFQTQHKWIQSGQISDSFHLRIP